MKRTNSTNLIVRESITEALFLLMAKKDFQAIQIKELTELAGVGRASFYRNYSSKEEIVLLALTDVAISWWGDGLDKQDDWQEIFDLLKFLKPKLTLVKKSGAEHLIFDFLRQIVLSDRQDEKDSYEHFLLVGAFYGIVIKWIADDYNLKPTDLAGLMQKFKLSDLY